MTAISFQEASIRSEIPIGRIHDLAGLGYFKVIQNPFDQMIDQDSFDQYLANKQPPVQEQQEMIIRKMEVKMITKLMDITPEMAERCLSKNPLNRKLDMDKVRLYCEEMRRGRWRITHQGICFDEDGNLMDGQHRLKAICMAGIPIRMLVTKGVPRDNCLAIDIGKGRSLSNHAQMLGRPERTEHSAIARIIEYGPEKNVRPSMQDQIDLVQKYWEGVNFALSISQGTTKMYSVVRAVLARAYYTSDSARIKEFADVFKTEYEGAPENRAAITLKKYIRKLPYSLAPMYRSDIYQKAEVALRAFLEHRPLTTLKNPERELFELPEEMGAYSWPN